MAKKRAKSLSSRKSKRAARKAPARKSAKTAGKSAGKRKATGVDTLDVFVDASARALALPLDPAWRPAVRGNLDVTLRLAASFMDFPLPDEAEPAPVFVP